MNNQINIRRYELYIATSYRENSICAIARSAVAIGLLERFYTTLYLASFRNIANLLPGNLGRRMARELGRRAFPGIPSGVVESVESSMELMYVFTRRSFGRYAARFSTKMMYRVADRFDSSVAKRLHRKGVNAVFVGMPAASAKCLQTVKKEGGVGVLNFVNSHPVEHNRYLRELAGLPDCHHEMVPASAASKVEVELELADLILVPSGFVAAQLSLHGIPAHKVEVIPYGVDLKTFSPESDRQENTRNRHGKLECLFVGQISHRKGIHFLLDAAVRCRRVKVKFRLIGPLVSSEVLAGLPENVTYEGVKTPHAVGEAMRNADIFLLPTLEDSFALVVFEAMASGLPVITTSHAGSSEMISDGNDGFVVPPCDAGAISDAIRKLVEDSELRSRMGSAARKKVMGAYSWESYGCKVLNRIHTLLSGQYSQEH